MIRRFFKDRRPHLGLTYSSYVILLEQKAAEIRAHPQGALHDNRAPFYPLNLQRTRRIERTYRVSDRLRSVVAAMGQPQLWMVLTEPWCGDSAQNLPYVARIAEVNPRIELRILLRDEHPEVMDRYLTEGTRSIPKLVAFDLSGRELFTWGPRPQGAGRLFQSERASGAPREKALEALHRWYGTNKGKELETELLELLAD
jgi:Thioredoxin